MLDTCSVSTSLPSSSNVTELQSESKAAYIDSGKIGALQISSFVKSSAREFAAHDPNLASFAFQHGSGPIHFSGYDPIHSLRAVHLVIELPTISIPTLLRQNTTWQTQPGQQLAAIRIVFILCELLQR